VFLATPVVTQRDAAGVLRGFSFSFELAWRAVQEEIAARGYLERGPRPSLKAAFEAGLIESGREEVWAEMLEDRNLVAHMYRPEWALGMVDRIRDRYLSAFQQLVANLDQASAP
jgi:nucleotidyltransferase substrate binding protein (TIGR01987 family)